MLQATGDSWPRMEMSQSSFVPCLSQWKTSTATHRSSGHLTTTSTPVSLWLCGKVFLVSTPNNLFCKHIFSIVVNIVTPCHACLNPAIVEHLAFLEFSLSLLGYPKINITTHWPWLMLWGEPAKWQLAFWLPASIISWHLTACGPYTLAIQLTGKPLLLQM